MLCYLSVIVVSVLHVPIVLEKRCKLLKLLHASLTPKQCFDQQAYRFRV